MGGTATGCLHQHSCTRRLPQVPDGRFGAKGCGVGAVAGHDAWNRNDFVRRSCRYTTRMPFMINADGYKCSRSAGRLLSSPVNGLVCMALTAFD